MTVATAAVPIMAQPPEPAENRLFEQVYLAKDDGTGKPGDAATEFAPTDVPIHCVVVLSNARPTKVRMDLLVVNVNGVKPGTRVVSTSYVTKDLQDRVFFNGRPKGQWTMGTYRADIFIDEVKVGEFNFRINAPSASDKAPLGKRPASPSKLKKAGQKGN